MPAAAIITGIVEHTLNAWLQQSQARVQLPTNLVDQQVAVLLTDIKLQLNFAINAQGEISVLANVDSADCKITTQITTLQKLQDSSQITKLIKSGELDIEGDVQLAQSFADWLKSSLSRWQDVLAGLVGDIACYKLIHAGEQAQQAISQRVEQEKATALNAIWHEKRLAPHPDEFDVFSLEVNVLRQDYDRLAARTKRLAKLIEQSPKQ
ncbi:hypothetical protein C2869_10445 [Saccharobesus litoralis]|uniref:Ubiquinone biosynthesis accessory factor UbiJ n=1 Tax=Saccharobesus litoralis TaxID=2172099 RepID=A0A2S0VRK4_9ALTE|nr:SCP2 sterol-binding domain-containing protein [Saccharobesus litoralis]AWB66823.1 hypothetical protein C2869_10445 [Saccharobesus litoralis]